MARILGKGFFEDSADKVARKLIGKIIVRNVKGKFFRARIVETEAYFGEDDPASWARFGKRKDNSNMWSSPGKILVKNVHKYIMLNFVTGKKNEASAVLISAVEPLNFEGRCSGPGLLSKSLHITKNLNGLKALRKNGLYIEDSGKDFEIEMSFRVGVKEDLNKKLRYFIKGNKFVGKNGKRKTN